MVSIELATPENLYARGNYSCILHSEREKRLTRKKVEKKNETGEEDSECFPKEIAKIVKHHNFRHGIYVSRGNRGRRIRI